MPKRCRISPMPGSTISIAATSGARSRPTLNASAVRSRAQDLERYEAKFAEPLRIELPSGTIYNTGAPTQGVVVADDPGAVRTLRRDRRRKASITSIVWSRRPSARCGCATASSPIPTYLPQHARALSRRPLHRRRSDEDRPRARRRAGRSAAARATPSGWARPTAAVSWCPTSNRSIGNSARAACCRRPAC